MADEAQDMDKGKALATDPVGEETAKQEEEKEVEKVSEAPTPLELIPRPSGNPYGTRGEKLTLVANFFDVKYKAPKNHILLYDVQFSREIRNQKICRSLMDAMYSKFPDTFPADVAQGLAYDGQHTLFSLQQLDLGPQHRREFPIETSDPRRPDDAGEGPSKKPRTDRVPMVITLERAREIDMGDVERAMRAAPDTLAAVFAPDALRVLDVALRHYAAGKFHLLRSKFFDSSFGRVMPISGGIEAWTGYSVSFRPIEGRVALNLDIVAGTMVQPIEVIALVRSVLRSLPPRLSDVDRHKVSAILRNVKVTARPSGKQHKVVAVTRESSRDLVFEDRRNGGAQVSVLDYYKAAHGITLDHPDLPCISASNRPTKPCWIPLELCQVVGAQHYLRKLTPLQVTEISRVAAMPPADRKAQCENAVHAAGLTENEYLASFGINITPRLKRVQARQLQAPALQFGERGGQPSTMQPRDGQWNMNDKTCFTGVTINSWAVISFDSRVNAQAVAHEFALSAKRKNVVFTNRPIVIDDIDAGRMHPDAAVSRAFASLKAKLSTGPPDIIVWILDVRKTSRLYAPIKRECEVTHGIKSQCMVQPQRGFNDQYYTNVALKVNIKMGATNWALQETVRRSLPGFSDTPTMVFGLDVSHAGPGSLSPSIAAVVASMDSHASKFQARVATQGRRVEAIAGLYDPEALNKGMVCDLIDAFGKANKAGAKRIIIFRDGISESQFTNIGAIELNAFRMAATEAAQKAGVSNYQPKITYIVAQKRNNVRLFKEQLGNPKDNVPPGTIVDRDITHPYFFDFYLVAHKGLLGTSKPVHYHVLHDENNLTADEIQHLTHSLCYTYGRCTRAVSTVAPVYYAHLAAAHCRNFLDPEVDDLASEASAERRREQVMANIPSLPELHKKVKASMFFC